MAQASEAAELLLVYSAVNWEDVSLSFSPSCQPPTVDSCRTTIPDHFLGGKKTIDEDVILSDFPVNTAGVEQNCCMDNNTERSERS